MCMSTPHVLLVQLWKSEPKRCLMPALSQNAMKPGLAVFILTLILCINDKYLRLSLHFNIVQLKELEPCTNIRTSNGPKTAYSAAV